MKSTARWLAIVFLPASLVWIGGLQAQTPLGTAFSFQGRIEDGGEPAAGPYDLHFTLYDAETEGNAVGQVLSFDNVVVTDGVFTVSLDFGADVLAGDARWLELAVRPGDDTEAHTILAPRQQILAVPYAGYALRASADALASTTAGLVGEATAGSGRTYGVYGSSESSADDAVGVAGVVSPEGSGRGIKIVVPAPSGLAGVVNVSTAEAAGVYGATGGATGVTYGVHGITVSSTGGAAGVKGEATAGEGSTSGVMGRSSSAAADAAGVRGEAVGGVGVLAKSTGGKPFEAWTASGRVFDINAAGEVGCGPVTASTPGDTSRDRGIIALPGAAVIGLLNGDTDGAPAVYGLAKLSSGKTIGVEGVTRSTGDGAIGVRGEALGATGATVGVEGVTRSTANGAAGVKGQAQGATGVTIGVSGVTDSEHVGSAGVLGEAAAGIGVLARSASGSPFLAWNGLGPVFQIRETGEVWCGPAIASTDGDTTWDPEDLVLPGAAVTGLLARGTDGAPAVYGLAEQSTGETFGVLGVTRSTENGAAGVKGQAQGATGVTIGVSGRSVSDSALSAGVLGEAAAGIGVLARSASGSPFLAWNGLGPVFQIRETGEVWCGPAIASTDGDTTWDPEDLVLPGAAVTGLLARGTDGAPAVYGLAEQSTGETFGVLGVTRSTAGDATGVKGQAQGTTGATVGVSGRSVSDSALSAGVLGEAAAGIGVLARSESGNPLEAWNTDQRVFRVSNSGDVYADGSYTSPAADFAEMMPADEGLAPGDVLSVAPDGRVTLAGAANAAAVVGVYSTQPGFVGGAGGEEQEDALTVPVAIMGVVPVKVTTENGPIRPNDLLAVSTALAGHAAKAVPAFVSADGQPVYSGETVVGRALEGLDSGPGVIQVLLR